LEGKMSTDAYEDDTYTPADAAEDTGSSVADAERAWADAEQDSKS
jgi:hypothetical protein